MTIAGQVEIDPFCRRILERHWPEVPKHDDVRTCVPWWWGTGRRADVVCGGFPCQPVSVAGKGEAQADQRWLWPDFAHVVRQLRPRYVLLENVSGLLGRGLGDVLGDLAHIGYDASWDCLPAAAFGAPHLRNRVFIIAYPGRKQLRHESGRRGGQDRTRPAVAGNNGTSQPVADADGVRRDRGADIFRPWRSAPVGQEKAHHARDRGEPLADPDSVLRRHRHDGTAAVLPGAAGEDAGRWQALRNPGFWDAEPGVGRVADGVPGRMDQLRGLGNAVVPQVARYVGELIMEDARCGSW